MPRKKKSQPTTEIVTTDMAEVENRVAASLELGSSHVRINERGIITGLAVEPEPRYPV